MNQTTTDRELEELDEIMTYMGFDRDDFKLIREGDNISIQVGIISPVVTTKRSHGVLNFLEDEGWKVLYIAGDNTELGKMRIAVKKA
jgi:hypothetical protein